MATPDISIVIPVYNRDRMLRLTLGSVARAAGAVNAEVIVVDDGSTNPVTLDAVIPGLPPTRVIRQPNQGLLYARLTGLRAATGRSTLFLDSDDFITPEKLSLHVQAMATDDVVVSYSDSAQANVSADDELSRPVPDRPLEATASVVEFMIRVQPPPHSPVFNTAWLQAVVANPLFPPSAHYNPVAEIWFYHVCAVAPGRVAKVTGPHAIVGHHPGTRLTNHWERLGVASLAVMEAFVAACPAATPGQRLARSLVGAKAFASWRRLARGGPAEFEARLLQIWRQAGAPPPSGGRLFQSAASVLGAATAGRLFRTCQAPLYESCRTMTSAEFAQLLRTIPEPAWIPAS